MDLISCQKALDEAKAEAAYHQSTAAYIRNERRHIEDRLMAAQADPTNPAVSEIFDCYSRVKKVHKIGLYGVKWPWHK